VKAETTFQGDKSRPYQGINSISSVFYFLVEKKEEKTFL